MESTFKCIRQDADSEQIKRCHEIVSLLGESFDYLSEALTLAGNKVRLTILYMIHRESRLCVCDISDILSMSIPAISQHLRKLKDRGLITTKREKQTIFYSLTNEYEELFSPFFSILNENKILEAI